MAESLEEKLKDVVAEQLGIDKSKIENGSKFVEDLGADSLDLVELIMAFEEKFGVEIPEEKAEGIKTVEDAILYIKSITN